MLTPRGKKYALVPVMRVPPDLLNVEFYAAAQIDRSIFFSHFASVAAVVSDEAQFFPTNSTIQSWMC